MSDHEVGIVITVTLDNEHIVNECFTARSGQADDALAYAIDALQTAERTCDERCEAEYEAMMDAKFAKSAAALAPHPQSENASEK
jgi:hypothetical protein